MTAVTTTAAPAPPRRSAAVRAAAARESVARLVVPMPADRLVSWVAALAVTAVAGVLRFVRLGDPHAFVFDETYYAKDAWSLIHNGAEQQWAEQANERILAGQPERWTDQPAYVVHPPGGKWLIGTGEAVFGFDPFGWRFAVAVLGTLSVLVLIRAGRRLFRSTLLGCTAGLLMTVDGMHFVHSRTALLDLVLMFWALLAFACLLVDRDATRERLAADVVLGVAAAGFGPRLGWRPWRLAAGVCLGLGCATKWSGLWFVVAFGLLSWAWDLAARRAAGFRVGMVAVVALASAVGLAALAWAASERSVPSLAVALVVLSAAGWAFAVVRPDREVVRAAYGHGGGAVAALLLVPLGVYLLSWAGWFLADPQRAWKRHTDALVAHGLAGFAKSLVALWHYHQEAFEFHRTLETFHAYAASPWSWLVLGRPVSFFYEGPKRGEGGCTVESCSKAITALGTPLLWWGAVLALAVVLGGLLGRRDWRAGAILAGLAGGYLPWFLFQDRTIYSFYAVAFVPWLVLAVTYALGLLIGPAHASEQRRLWGSVAAGSYVLAVVLNFAFLYPVLSAQLIPYQDWAQRMWLDSWI